MAPPRRRHDRNGGAADPEWCLDIHRHGPCKIGVGRVGNGAPGHEAGVVCDDVEPVKRGRGLPRQRIGVGAVAQVTGKPYVSFNGRPAVKVRRRHRRTFAPECHGDGRTDAT